MSDQGAIGTLRDGVACLLLATPGQFPVIRRTLRLLGVETLHLDAGRENVDGDPSAPCMRVIRGGTVRFRFPVSAGNRRLSVRARELSTQVARPELVIKANPEIGLNADMRASAPAGTDWVVVGPLEFAAVAVGGIVVELRSYGMASEGDCRWDTFALA